MASSLQLDLGKSPLVRLFRILEFKRQCFINDLWEFVGFRTVSGKEEHLDELREATDWLIKRLTDLNVIAFSEHLGVQLLPDTLRRIEMPKTIIGVLSEQPGKPTILVYGHLDVADAHSEEGWRTEPFVLTEQDEYLYGRGTTCGKGPLLCWLNAIQVYKDAGVPLPVNIVFLIESMAHSNSMGLEYVLLNRISFFRNVSCVCIADGRWLTNTKPCIICGTNGLIYYSLEVEIAKEEDGVTLYEALPDLFYLLSALITPDNNIFMQEAGINKPSEDEQKMSPKSNSSMPRISLHGIDSSDSDTDVPSKVIGNFSVVLAPHQNPTEVKQRLTEFLGRVWRERGSPNKMLLYEHFSIPAWTGKRNMPEYEAARRANFEAYDEEPAVIRDGGAMLAPSIFARCLGKNVIVLPIAGNDYCRGPTNERLAVDKYIGGSRMLAAFMYELSKPTKAIGLR